MNILNSQNNFHSLSISDLLDAREHYHAHLMNKQNVIGSAVGLYLIRNDEPAVLTATRKNSRDTKQRPPRTFSNSTVRPDSWPCVLVLVDAWVDECDFSGALHPTDMVPNLLYMPDGRVVPVCVVLVTPSAPQVFSKVSHEAPRNWPASRIGGGFPLQVQTQGRTLSASVGCLVSDGHTVFALTNRHVVGAAGQEVFSQLRGRQVPIGSASDLYLTRLPFNAVYPDLPACHGYLNLDIGLVEIDDVNDWTSRTFGLPEVGGLADLNAGNLGTQLIEQPVFAYGAASGLLEGRIKALFYRYRSVAGVDTIADLLIAPLNGATQTRPGDSGTVWHLRIADAQAASDSASLRPLAVEWGGQGFTERGITYHFALATNLSNVCQLLNVELVSAHNTGVRPFWGATGHYSIARYAIDTVDDVTLRDFLLANAANIAFDRTQLEDGEISAQLNANQFVPLADVADVVWKKTSYQTAGGRDVSANVGPEHPTHYADVDQPGLNGAPSLLELGINDPAQVSVKVWQDFYDALGHTGSAQRGLLPFRVWQIFDAMVEYASVNDTTRFLAAAGILAHYVGDACQPLHGSVYSNGYAEQATVSQTSSGKPKKNWPGQGVHSAYETKMIDEHAPELFDAIEQKLRQPATAWPAIDDGHAAAVATLQLMHESQRLLPPRALCDTYIQLGQGASKAVIDGMWQTFGDATAQAMADGARMLAYLWKCAWQVGDRSGQPFKNPGVIAQSELQALYRDPAFLPSLDLDQIGEILRANTVAGSAPAAAS